MTALFTDHFSGHAADYAKFRPCYPEVLARYLAEQVNAVPAPIEHTVAWECGCGNGQFSGLLAAHFDEVIATDASAAQIAQAPAHPRVVYQVGRAEDSLLADHSVSLIVAAQAAHWFNLPAFYAEVDRVARPGAVLALVCYGLNRVSPAIDATLQTFYEHVLGPYWPAERAHIEAGYKTLSFPYAELQAPALVLEAEWDYAHYVGYIETWSAWRRWLRANRFEHGPIYQRFLSELRAAWGPASAVKHVVWPLSMRMARMNVTD